MATLVRAGQAASFNTMTPHSISGHGGPAELLTILDHHGERAQGIVTEAGLLAARDQARQMIGNAGRADEIRKAAVLPTNKSPHQAKCDQDGRDPA